MLLDPDDPTIQAGVNAPEIRLAGEMDMATAYDMLAPAHQFAVDGHRHLTLNCAELTFCDTEGLRALIVLFDAVQPDGSVTLADPSDTLIKLLTLIGVADDFTIRLSADRPPPNV